MSVGTILPGGSVPVLGNKEVRCGIPIIVFIPINGMGDLGARAAYSIIATAGDYGGTAIAANLGPVPLRATLRAGAPGALGHNLLGLTFQNTVVMPRQPWPVPWQPPS